MTPQEQAWEILLTRHEANLPSPMRLLRKEGLAVFYEGDLPMAVLCTGDKSAPHYAFALLASPEHAARNMWQAAVDFADILRSGTHIVRAIPA